MGGTSLSDTHDESKNNETLEKIEDSKEAVLALPSSLFKSIEESKKLYSACQPLFLQLEVIQRMQETLCFMTKITESIVAAQRNQYNEICSPAVQQIVQNFANIPQLYIDFDYRPMVIGLKSLIENDAFRKSVLAAQKMYDSIVAVYSPVIEWIQSLDFSPLFESLQAFSIPEIKPDKIEKIYLFEMYDAHWFPGSILCADIKLTFNVIDIVGSTRKNKNRVKRIDRAIFGYYTRTTIEKMKMEWRRLDLPEHLMRILHQAVQAYHRKEYAITVIVLSTQWEGIIYRKAHDNGRKSSKKTKKYFSTLTSQNNYLEIFKSYYDDFIMYDCNSLEETIADVPGRHSAAHSFYETYPTRKAALNAILFTDFLLKLKPLEEEN